MDFKSLIRTSTAEHEVNMTPLIDVSLVLVVILLLTSPLAFESSIGVRNEDTTAQTSKTEDQVERIEVVVVDDETVRVNETIVAREQLVETLRPMIAKSIDHKQHLALISQNTTDPTQRIGN